LQDLNNENSRHIMQPPQHNHAAKMNQAFLFLIMLVSIKELNAGAAVCSQNFASISISWDCYCVEGDNHCSPLSHS
jgi:hypothetical protein